MISLKLIIILAMLVISGSIFSGAETGIYQLSRLRLRIGIEKRRLLSVILGKAMRDSGGLLISLLIGTNLSLYLITSIVTYMFLSGVGDEHKAELFATLVTAPVLFVFSEVIPKNIFYYRADGLLPIFSPILYFFHIVFTWSGVGPLLKLISGFIGKLTGAALGSQAAISAVRPSYVRAIFHETREEGFLSPVQSDMVNRLEAITHLRIKNVMIGINKTETVKMSSGKEVLLNILKKHAFSRLPVYDVWEGNIVGFVNIYDCLNSEKDFGSLDAFVKPIRKLSGQTLVSEAMKIMQQESEKIVLVTRKTHTGRQKALGIVTMKDLVEELLGELSEW
jgi:CBS domain containing-hemolysin-like protein